MTPERPTEVKEIVALYYGVDENNYLAKTWQKVRDSSLMVRIFGEKEWGATCQELTEAISGLPIDLRRQAIDALNEEWQKE
jgi:hypothetical protein